MSSTTKEIKYKNVPLLNLIKIGTYDTQRQDQMSLKNLTYYTGGNYLMLKYMRSLIGTILGGSANLCNFDKLPYSLIRDLSICNFIYRYSISNTKI